MPIPLGLAAVADALTTVADAGLRLFRIVCLVSIGVKWQLTACTRPVDIPLQIILHSSLSRQGRKSGFLSASQPAQKDDHSAGIGIGNQDHQLPFGPTALARGARFHLSQKSLEMVMEDSNGFASYSVEPTPSPTAATLTLAPTYDENFSTPYPTYDQGYYDDDDDMTPLMRAYATIGFIIRIFLPIILIVMCCRLKRRGEFADGLGGVGGGGRAQDGGFVSGETRMDPEERKRYVEERLCSKVRDLVWYAFAPIL